MPNFKVEIDLEIEKINYCGDKINCGSDISLRIDIFNKIKYSKYRQARFPIRLCEHFCFKELIFNSPSWKSVLNKLNECPVTIELIEIDCICKDNSVAYFDTNVRDLTELCGLGTQRSMNRSINMINKTSIRSYTTPSICYSCISSISNLLSCDGESGFYPSPCIPKPKRSLCCPSLPRSCSPKPSFERSCFEGMRPLSPLVCCPPRPRSILSRRCSPISISSDRSCIPDCRPKQKWELEISRLTKNLREVSDQIRQLVNMQKFRIELNRQSKNRCGSPYVPRLSTSMPCGGFRSRRRIC